MLIRNLINIIFKLSIFFAIFVLIGSFFFRVVLKTKKNEKNSSFKHKIYGLFMELDNFSILAISVTFIRFIFLVYLFCNRSDLLDIHLYTLLLLSILFGIFSKSVKNLIIDMGSSFALYFAFYSSKLLSNYLIEIRFIWYIWLGNMLLLLFILLYAFYFCIRNMNDVVSRTKYVRRIRNEEH